MDFIPALSPRWVAPLHLKPLVSALERSRHEQVFAACSVPPRHAKTETVKHAIVHRLLEDPSLRIGYGGYSAQFAHKKSREIRTLFRRAGGPIANDARAVGDWRTGVEDGGLWANGTGGSWTGEGMSLIFIDDPVKGRSEAESGTEREKLWDWFQDDLSTRLEPGGSIFLISTRWHCDDLIGRAISHGIIGRKVEYICLPALSEENQPLWPERFSTDELERIKKSKGEYSWASLYQGQPFPRGGRVFHDPIFYDELPEGLRISIGVDLAYSKKTSADYSVIVVMGRDDITEKSYILQVVRAQEEAPVFAQRIVAVQKEYDGVPARWHYAGAEKAIGDFLRTLNVDMDMQPAVVDKFVRSQPFAAAWNDGKVLLPRPSHEEDGESWQDELVAEYVAFTGKDDLRDDQVDAGSSAFDAAASPDWVSQMAAWKRQKEGQKK